MYRRVFGVELDPDKEVLPLIGTKEGIFHLSQVLVNPGDTVLVPDPGYPTYAQGVLFAGGQLYLMPLLKDNDYLPDLEAVPEEVRRRAKMMWMNYPNNPTAADVTPEFFERTVDFAREHELLLCHDAAYSQVTYGDYRAPSILQVPGAKEVAVEFNSLSKSHNMAGWRVGAVMGNPEVVKALLTLKTNLDSGHFRPVWKAAESAMSVEQRWVDERNEVYRRRRDIVVEALGELGLSARVPLGSMYVWCRIPEGWESEAFTRALLEEAGISVTPGTVFGARGEGYCRISLTVSEERLAEVTRRWGDWWKGQGAGGS
jgi:LL-diaminopimelate aminotransferase